MRSWLGLVIGVILLGIAIAGFTLLFERYEERVWEGASQQVKRNPFLATQRFLEQQGTTVVSDTSQLEFNQISRSDMVFLSEVDSILVSRNQIDAAMEWVKNGGFLIVGVGQESQGYDSILKRFDLRPKQAAVTIEDGLFSDDELTDMSASERMREINRRLKERQQKQSDEEQNTGVDGVKPMESDKAVIDENDSFNDQLINFLNVDYKHEYYKVYLGEEVGDIHLAVLDRITLLHPWIDGEDDASDNTSVMSNDQGFESYEIVSNVADENGTRLIQFGHGEGTFTAISSSRLWNNDYIGVADHAHFLSYIVPKGSRLHLFYNFNVPGLWEILKKVFAELLFVLLIILVLWLWRRGMRVQRQVDVTDGQRRDFSEHLAASAKFMVANKQFQPLVNSLRNDIANQMRPFYPGFAQLNQSAQITMLMERTQLPQSVISDWVAYCEKVENQEQLLLALKLGNAIRKKL